MKSSKTSNVHMRACTNYTGLVVGQVTQISMDRHKVVTATDQAGEGPVRAWSHAGDEYAVLESSLYAPSCCDCFPCVAT